MRRFLILLLFLSSLFAAAQTPVPSTERSVATLPSTCNGGNAKVPTDVVALITSSVGREYVCTATNTWVPRALVIASGSTGMGISSIDSASCTSPVTVAVSAILVTDNISISFDGNPTTGSGFQPVATGMLTIVPYTTAGNVNFLVCNITSAAITPAAININWIVSR